MRRDPRGSGGAARQDGLREVRAASEPVVIPTAEGRFSVRAWQIPDADGATAGEHLSLTALPDGSAEQIGRAHV